MEEEKVIIEGKYKELPKKVLYSSIAVIVLSLWTFWPLLILGVIVLGLYFGVNKYLSKTSIVVTADMVKGVTGLGKQVELPIDSISTVVTSKMFKAVRCATSSGLISFAFLSNYVEVKDEISKLVLNRIKQDDAKSINSIPETNNTDDLAKLKKLLDDGIITQEDFDAKKKQILGL